MKQLEGWWVPDHSGPPGAYLRRAEALFAAVQAWGGHSGHYVAVQAGGHIGIVPRGLSLVYETVLTFEPEARNFECLVRNTSGRGGIYAARGALVGELGLRALAVHPKSTGGHRLDGEGPGPVPGYRIDDLALGRCDLIALDLEGYELEVLKGAAGTLAACRPLVIAEENAKMKSLGRKAGDMERWLAQFGYKRLGVADEDLVLGVVS